MADYAAKIAQARKAGYSDAEIVGFLSKNDQKVQQAKAAGYNDADIIGHLSPAKAVAKPAATPAVKPAAKPPAKPTAGQFASGLGAALGRGLLIADELQGATRAARNVLAGESKVDPVKLLGVVANYNNPVAAGRAFEESGAGAALRTGMAQQRAGEDRFTATNPKSAALARGTGNALTMLVPGGQVGAAMQGGRAMNMLRGATAAAAPAAAMSFADRGNLQERLGAANQGALVGGLLGAAGGALAKTPPSAARKKLAENAAILEEANIQPNLASAGNPAWSKVANATAENPIGVRPRNQLRRSISEAGDEASRLSQEFGSSRGAQITGENVQEGIQRFARGDGNAAASPSAPAKASSFSSKAERLYDDAFLPIETAEARAVAKNADDFTAAEAAAMKAYEDHVRKVTAKYEADVAKAEREAAVKAARMGLSNVKPVEVSKPNLPPPPVVQPQRAAVVPTQTTSALREMSGRVNAPRLSNMITDGRIRSIASALEDDAYQVRFGDLRALRTWVREAQRDPQLRQGISQAGLQRVEQALTSDIYANAERLGGPRALSGLRRADAYYRTGSSRIKGALQAFDDAGSGETAYRRIIQAAQSGAGADAKKLLALKRSLSSDEWGDVAANAVRDLGKPSPGSVGAMSDDAFSVSTFVTNYNKMSDRGKDILFGSIGGGGSKATRLRGELDNLAKAADLLKGVEKGANTSNTGTALQAIGTVGAVANPATTIPALKMLAGVAITGEMVTNPAVVKWLTRAAELPAGASNAQMAAAARQLEAIKAPEAQELYRQVAARLGAAFSQATPSSASVPR